MSDIRPILHPTDFSEASDDAFQVACALARARGAGLHVLHVLHVAGHLVVSRVEGSPDAEHDQEEPTTKLHEIRPEDAGIPVEHQLLLGGDPATEILRIAQAIQADLIVMGTHGRTGLRRLLLGSVAEQVVRRASCPVVTVKGPRPHHAPAQPPAVPACRS
jgi:nucleotide-binding universal stress UspA family protein